MLKTIFKEFFPPRYGNNIMSEYNCEIRKVCDGNSALFKGVTIGWLATMTTLVSETYQEMLPKFQASAQGAAKQCSGGSNGRLCGSRWYQDTWDGTSGMGQETTALSGICSSLITEMKNSAPKSRENGGHSKPDGNAGTGGNDNTSPDELKKITAGDKAGASILTVVFVLGWVGAITWMIWD